MTERQIIAVLTVLGATAGLGFAIFNLYYAFKYPNGVTAAKKT